MDIIQAIENRHSVRSYTGEPIPDEKAGMLLSVIDQCNRAGNLRFQLVRNEPKAFSSPLARYGKFSGVMDYIAVVGPKSADLEEKCGYYGEKLVLEAQMIGLNTCWVGLTYRKIPGTITVGRGEKLLGVISVGYGRTQGVPRRSKSISDICSITGDEPEWFIRGLHAVLLAPTAVNQQKFRFSYKDGRVRAESGSGFYTRTDLGIAKYHFETASGKGPEIWE
jgi:nitroreductase